MHNLQTKKRLNKTSLLALGAAILLLAGATYAAYTYKVWPFIGNQSEEEKAVVASESDLTNPRQKANLPSVENEVKTGANKTTEEIPVANSGTLDITTLEQRDMDIVYAASLQNAAPSGTCSALFEHSAGAARPVTRVTKPTADGCPETAVPEVEFVARGDWKLTLRYFVNDTQLVATKTFEVK